MTGYRLPTGGRIDRSRPISFVFDGRAYQGFAGDTLASALLANGVRIFGRSFKLHRPRGLVTAGPEEPNALVEVGDGDRRTPNWPATMVELTPGLVARSQNRWPSLAFDLMAVNGLFAPLLTAGFYYKTFKRPAAFWERVYEPLIRRAAGLGRAPCLPDPDHYEAVHHHCDALIVGAGPAGLAAGVEAGRAGGRVLLVETANGLPVEGLPLPANVTVLTRTTVVGAYEHGTFVAVERSTGGERLWVVRAKRAIVATGATERLIAFPGNDRPGVMLASAVRRYAGRYAVAAGRRVALFVNNDEAYATALELHAVGVEVAAIIDPRTVSIAADHAHALGLPVLLGHEVVDVVANRHGVYGVMVRAIGASAIKLIPADVLAVSGGYSPNVQLLSQAQVPLRWEPRIAAFVPAEREGPITAVGAASGELGEVLPFWRVRAPGKAFVDLQHDVTVADIEQAHREGYSHIEHAKRYTTHTMGTDQGKIGGLVGVAVLAEARGVPIGQVGLPRFRPFAVPITWGALAGSEVGTHFKPERLLPLHDWHEAAGAVFVKIGLWLRPLVYSPSGDTSWGPVLEEARAVRRSVGLTDASSLGKIDVQGPDAATFLERIYTNRVETLDVGRCRYGLMLREDGILLDDGTIARPAVDHFLLTTTTQKAEDVLLHLEWHLQTVWPELDVTLTNVGDHWAQLALAGPNARQVLERVTTGIDLGNAAFPFMATGEASFAGVPGRLFRISFSGELAYELAVPSAHALTVWEALLAAGAEHGIRPYGLDALNVMRIEKGHVTGAELNGNTTPHDLGLGKLVKKQGDFVGRVLSQRPGLRDPGRPQLVGVTPVDPAQRLRGGAHLVAATGKGPSQGFLTSVGMAAAGEGWIGLGLLQGGHGRHGERLVAASPVYGEAVEVVIGSPHRLDPENARVRG